jgi:hypothetical protein
MKRLVFSVLSKANYQEVVQQGEPVRIPVKCAGVPGEMLPVFKTLKFPKYFKAGGMFHPESLA